MGFSFPLHEGNGCGVQEPPAPANGRAVERREGGAERDIYRAMLQALDTAVGSVVKTLQVAKNFFRKKQCKNGYLHDDIVLVNKAKNMYE